MSAQRRKGSRGSKESAAEDTLAAWGLRALDWGRRNQRGLVLLVIGLAVLIAGVVYYVDYRGRVTELAAGEMRNLRAQVQRQSGQNAIQGLQSFIAEFGDTPYGTEARVLLAEQLMWQGRAREALEPARRVAEDLGSDPLATRAAFLLGAAHEEVGDTMAAIRTYERIGAQARLEGERATGLESAARLRAASGDLSGAIALYDRLIGMVPEGSSDRAMYELRKAELEAREGDMGLSEGSEVGAE